MRSFRKQKSDLSNSQESSSSALGTTTGISVASRSLLSGSFPLNYDGGNGAIQIHSTFQVPLEIGSCCPSVHEKPTLKSHLSSLSADTTAREEDEEEKIDTRSFAKHLEKLWQNEPHNLIQTSSRPLNFDDCQFVYRQMIVDSKQLQRILIARKYDLQESTSLFFEQVRFRARWKPELIQPKDVPNALPCRFSNLNF